MEYDEQCGDEVKGGVHVHEAIHEFGDPGFCVDKYARVAKTGSPFVPEHCGLIQRSSGEVDLLIRVTLRPRFAVVNRRELTIE